jgi:hypothetical protein
MQFFSFGNDETYHFFKWVTESGLVDVDALIAQAFKDAEDDEWLKRGFSVSSTLREKLSSILLETMLSQSPNLELVDPDLACHRVDDTGESLWMPILGLAFQRIDHGRVAEALLIRAGKWNPDKTIPTVE